MSQIGFSIVEWLPLILVLFLGGEEDMVGLINPEPQLVEMGVEYSAKGLIRTLDLPATADADTIRMRIRELGADRFETREAAGEALRSMGGAARPALTRAARDPDPEVAQRAKLILDTLKVQEEADSDLKRRLAILGLSRIGGEAAGSVLKSLAEGPHPEEAALARRCLNATATPAGQEKIDPPWFPEETAMLARLAPPVNPLPFKDNIHESELIQELLGQKLLQIGNVHLKSLWIGASPEAIRNPRNGLIWIRVDAEIDPRRLAGWLTKTGQATVIQSGKWGAVVLGPVWVVPVSSSRYWIVHVPDSGGAKTFPPDLMTYLEPAERKASGLDRFKPLPEASMWGALHVPDGFEWPADELKTLRTLKGEISYSENQEQWSASILLSGNDEQEMAALQQTTSAVWQDALDDIDNENHPMTRDIAQVLRATKMGREDRVIKMTADIPGTLPFNGSSFLLEKRRMMRRHMHKMRHR